MKFKLLTLTLTLIFTIKAQSGKSQEIPLAKIEVHAGGHDRYNTPVSANLEGLALNLETYTLKLYELDGRQRIAKASQLEPGYNFKIWWVLDGHTSAGKSRKFELVKVPKDTLPNKPAIAISKEDGALRIESNGKKVLQYQFAPIAPPAGVSDIYSRSGFIHPLWSPAGETLTRIQPADHYHHVGIWNPWTKTKFEGKEIDFWNLNKAEGTVRFKTFTATTSGDVFGGFKAVHEHVDLKGYDPSGAKVALNEVVNVRIWNVDPEGKRWLIDFVSTMNCATESGLLIKEYRYEGFGFRATEKWNDKTAQLLTSAGKDKSNGNATRARWCDVRGKSVAGTSGIVFMTHPSNYNFPEPIRIWPIGANGGKGNVFFNFNPAMDRDWKLEPGKSYVLKYRMMVYDGEVEKKIAEQYWNDFANPPGVEMEAINL